LASPLRERQLFTTPVVTITAPQATITGLGGYIEQFPGIPFALPPTGSLRLKPPQPIQTSIGNYEAFTNANSCPQFVFSGNSALNGGVSNALLGDIADSGLVQKILSESEDCLYINIQRPAGTNSTSKLPVLYWIFGGGFELGWNFMYDGIGWVQWSIDVGQPIIFVAVQYRVGGFGFLGGSEILKDGSANLGLLDQRAGLQWISDNVEAFGGDPSKVTIWGESAGSISVFDQMLAYDGNHTYNGKPLFRGAIMNSGSVVPADPVDCPKAQNVYNNVVDAGGCTNASDTLECLRGLPYNDFLYAVNSVPAILSYQSVALSYLPRPDGTFMTDSADNLILAGKFADVPFIIGDQEDEGTLFALFQWNITTDDEIVDYFSEFYFPEMSRETLETLASYYDNSTNGSPYRTGDEWNWYPQFKKLAAIIGDITFIMTRRALLFASSVLRPNVPTWTYLSSYDYGTPVLGSFHGGDILQVFYCLFPNYACQAFHAYYLNFVNNLDPNVGHTDASYPAWPVWNGTNHPMVNMFASYSEVISDTFREEAYQFLFNNVHNFRI